MEYVVLSANYFDIKNEYIIAINSKSGICSQLTEYTSGCIDVPYNDNSVR